MQAASYLANFRTMKRCIYFFFAILASFVFAEQENSPSADSGVAAMAVEEVSTEPVVERLPEPSTSETLAETPKEPIVTETAPAPEPVNLSAAENSMLWDKQEMQTAKDQEEKKGGLMNSLYPVSPDEAIAKGNFFGGVSLFLLQGSTEDDALNVLFGDIYDAEGYMFTVEAFGGYFIGDAMALAIKGGYSRTNYNIDFALMEDLLDVAEHRQYVSNGFFVRPYLKNYLKVLDSKSIYFFNETSVQFEYSYGISQADDGDDLSKTRNKSYSIDVGINPGLSIMVLDKFAFETSVGLLGLSSTIMDIEENGERHSKVTFNMVSFTINLLALSFSLVTFF